MMIGYVSVLSQNFSRGYFEGSNHYFVQGSYVGKRVQVMGSTVSSIQRPCIQSLLLEHLTHIQEWKTLFTVYLLVTSSVFCFGFPCPSSACYMSTVF